MTAQPSIIVDKLVKMYHRRGQLQAIRDSLLKFPRQLMGLALAQDDTLYALKDVGFQVMPGEAFGVIGPNGAGKTTLLRLLAGITEPSSGNVVVPGQVAAIIELGSGFHPDLTGHENTTLYAAICGMSSSEIKAGYDDIIAFAELQPYMDMALKHFSSGMYVRLAFAIATYKRPDVLVIDEVLAVGDASFQTKSLRRIRELKDSGTAIVYVSHNLHAVRTLCDRAMLLYRGQAQAIGATESVVSEYLDHPKYQSVVVQTDRPDDFRVNNTSEAKLAEITKVSILDSNNQERTYVKTGDAMTVHIEYLAHKHIALPTFTIAIFSVDGSMYAGHQSDWDGLVIDSIEGPGVIEAVFEHLNLLPGGYLLSISISDSQGFSKYDWHQKAYRLYVLVGKRATGLFYLDHKWQMRPDLQAGTSASPVNSANNGELQV